MLVLELDKNIDPEIHPTWLNHFPVVSWPCMVLKSSSDRTREVVFPRFKLEQNYDLIEHLKEMGLSDPFTEKGDFSPMTSEKVIINWVREQLTNSTHYFESTLGRLSLISYKNILFDLSLHHHNLLFLENYFSSLSV